MCVIYKPAISSGFFLARLHVDVMLVTFFGVFYFPVLSIVFLSPNLDLDTMSPWSAICNAAPAGATVDRTHTVARSCNETAQFLFSMN